MEDVKGWQQQNTLINFLRNRTPYLPAYRPKLLTIISSCTSLDELLLNTELFYQVQALCLFDHGVKHMMNSNRIKQYFGVKEEGFKGKKHKWSLESSLKQALHKRSLLETLLKMFTRLSIARSKAVKMTHGRIDQEKLSLINDYFEVYVDG
eukprot:TRINITY_DN4249_c0_g1_i16.p1 TRINITY_DN4249_c0_g1~~TRINITY_DN4249_c0_g1_i16.p1  ORF type:complete len:151 (-),score=7.29 TRINITY_DN4249_c0_g1_i16:658-1110(-)